MTSIEIATDRDTTEPADAIHESEPSLIVPSTATGAVLLAEAARIADEILAPAAQDVDRADIVPQSHLRSLAAAGLFDLTDCTPQETRRIMATIAGACGATFFVWVQHHGVLRQLTDSANTDLAAPLLPDLATGDSIAGFTMAHLRRLGPPAVRAERTDTGWELNGFAPWATSWGIADWFAVAAESDNGEMVWALLPGRDTSEHQVREGMIPLPLNLPVLTATGTVSLRFENCQVHDSEIIEISDAHQWRHDDRFIRAPGAPAILGVADRAIRMLFDAKPGDTERLDVAERLHSELELLWATDDRYIEALHDPAQRTDETIAAASDHRAACLMFGQRATTALLAASGGGGMDLKHPAQRLAREAVFYIIQAQTADGRSGTLRSI